MERIVVFRFHRDPEVCRSRLRLLRQLNPGVPIYGLGERIGLEGEFEDLHVIDDRDAEWKWKNGDLALARWFRAVGHEVDFDVAHVVEWDLLLCAPLSELYGHVPPDALALSGLRSMDAAREDGWSWIDDEGSYQHADDYRQVREWAARRFGFEGEGPSCIFPGAALPRSFLVEHAALDPPAVSNDEVRVPLAATALGYDLYDTGFHDWTDAGRRYFNGRGTEVPPSRVAAELADPDGRRAFHPVYEPIDPDEVPNP
ncbi:hypothetical protein BRD00_07045 [Halobacteriales archaeon QS_8_69_26]|nr:MAG: hypothetical protein BRD00_07045 [Halobacteriales archaeon QS_8_69_26]